MYLKNIVFKHNIYIIWYIKCNDILMKLGWENIHRNVFGGNVFRKDTLIELKGKFP